MEKKDNVEVTMSHSQAKREERRKQVAHARRSARIWSIVGYAALAVVAALIVVGIVFLVNKQLDKVTPNSDYSAGLTSNGYIAGVDAQSKINLPEYLGIKVPADEIEYSEESIDTDIATLVAGYKTISNDESLKVADGDVVNIGYVGTIDGVAFDRGTSDSYDLTIGSGQFIAGFEQQLIGAQNGSTVEVNVTFPENYNNDELSGKSAVFTVDIKGIYAAPDFTDDFVAENLSDKASTVEGYRQYVKATKERENLEGWVKDYLINNTTVKSYPKKYVNILKSVKMFDDEQSYEYMNQLYTSYYGSAAYNSFEEYVGTSMDEYYQTLKTQAQDTCKENLLYQAIVEKEGAVADAEYFKAHLEATGQGEAYYESEVANAGEPFVLQEAIAAKAIEIAADAAVVE